MKNRVTLKIVRDDDIKRRRRRRRRSGGKLTAFFSSKAAMVPCASFIIKWKRRNLENVRMDQSRVYKFNFARYLKEVNWLKEIVYELNTKIGIQKLIYQK